MAETNAEFAKRNRGRIKRDRKLLCIKEGCSTVGLRVVGLEALEHLADACTRLEAADKFEQAIINRHNGYDPNTDYPEPNSPKEALDQLLKEAEQLGKTELQAKIEQQRWIPVSERLPKEKGYIDVANAKLKVPQTWCWTNTNAEAERLKTFMTHWRPSLLPEAEEMLKDKQGE